MALTSRAAQAGDAPAVAALHADSWRRHYRGAYADAFLDGDVLADRLAVWGERLREPDAGAATILAEDGGLVGFAHVVFGGDPAWGALLDNLHVAADRQRGGVGRRLMALVAGAVLDRPGDGGLYLWVLEQNAGGQAFYGACGGRWVERRPVTPPGGVAGRLEGSPLRLRYVWSRAALSGAAGRSAPA